MGMAYLDYTTKGVLCKMRDYSYKLQAYGISVELLGELKCFCRQYPDKVAELSVIRGGFNSSALTGLPRGNDTSDQTGNRAVRALRLGGDIEAIEQAAIAASDELYQYLLQHVTRGVSFYSLQPPCGINQFAKLRRAFFIELAKKLGKI